MKGNTSGVNFNDRKLAGEVRSLTLNECMRHLLAKKGKMYELVLNNLSRTVLPRLSEVTGESGQPFIITIDSAIATKRGINASPETDSA